MGGKRWVVSALIVVMATLGLAACGGGGDEPELAGRADLLALEKNSVPRFEPEEFEIRLNQETRFNFANDDEKREHNFTLTYVFVDADNFVSVDVPAKQSREVVFTARERPDGGTFTFYCRFHQSEGMSGKIRVL